MVGEVYHISGFGTCKIESSRTLTISDNPVTFLACRSVYGFGLLWIRHNRIDRKE